MAEETISIVVASSTTEQPPQTKGIFFSEGDSVEAQAIDIPVSKLRANLAKECTKFVEVMSEVKDEHGYKLADVEVGFEISGEGGVSFIGTAKIGARASIKIRFTRS